MQILPMILWVRWAKEVLVTARGIRQAKHTPYMWTDEVKDGSCRAKQYTLTIMETIKK
jgi:hypothetical protein